MSALSICIVLRAFVAVISMCLLYVLCDLRANILVACKVTPAIWLNLSNSRNIFDHTFWTIIKGTSPRFNWT